MGIVSLDRVANYQCLSLAAAGFIGLSFPVFYQYIFTSNYGNRNFEKAIKRILDCPSTKAFWLSVKADDFKFRIGSSFLKSNSAAKDEIFIPDLVNGSHEDSMISITAMIILHQLFGMKENADERREYLTGRTCSFSEKEYVSQFMELENKMIENLYDLALPCKDQGIYAKDYVSKLPKVEKLAKKAWRQQCEK